jgi:DNA replication protein DnaC
LKTLEALTPDFGQSDNSKVAEINARIAALGVPRFVDSIRRQVDHKTAVAQWRALSGDLNAIYDALKKELEQALEAEELKFKAARKEAAVERLLSRTGAPSEAIQYSSSPKQTMALKAMADWLRSNSKRWLILLGASGTGKTVAAAWAIRNAIRVGRTADYRRATSIARLSAYGPDKADLEHLQRVALLVIDDFGNEQLNDFAASTLFELFDFRHGEKLKTVVTSNLSASEFAAKIGVRLADRIQAEGEIKTLTGVSMRGRV